VCFTLSSVVFCLDFDLLFFLLLFLGQVFSFIYLFITNYLYLMQCIMLQHFLGEFLSFGDKTKLNANH
jgi:hypothetical protein